MNITTILTTLGMHPDEIRVYLALLKSPPATVSEIARLTDLHRPLIYRALPNLKEQGLISLAPKGKQKRYAAESPQRISRLFQDLRESFETHLPELEAAYLTKERRPILTFLEGKKGLTRVFEDLLQTLKRGDVFYRYSSIRDLSTGEKYLPKNYQEQRDRKQLERFVITNEKINAQTAKRLERMIKTIPPSSGTFEYDVTQIIYGPKVAFIDYGSETACIIENPVMAKFQIHLFKMLFDRL